MSMLWFDLWLSTGDREYLESSIRYNEDDCLATKVVKEWLGSTSRWSWTLWVTDEPMRP